jgi:hypothetical protein
VISGSFLPPVMLDTVAFAGRFRLRVPQQPGLMLNIAKGVKARVDVTGRHVKGIECSLPTVLFGHNGRVLSSQAEIDCALARLSEIAALVVDGPSLDALCPQRVDIAWNFDCPAQVVIRAHSHMRIPQVRKGPTRYDDDRGISWRGTRSAFLLTMYDKCRKMRVAGSCLRVELRLRGGKSSSGSEGSGESSTLFTRFTDRCFASSRPVALRDLSGQSGNR